MNLKYKLVQLIFAMVTILTLSACSQKTVEDHILLGQQSLSAGKISQAIIHFKNAIKIAPKDSAARLHLGNTYLVEGNYASAEKELSKALELGIEDEGHILNLAFARAKLIDIDGLEILREQFSGSNSAVKNGLLFYLGQAAMLDEDLDSAREFFKEVAASNINRYSKLSQAYLSYLNESYSEGLVIIDDLLKENIEDSEATLLEGHLYSGLSQFDKAVNSYTKHIELVTKDYNVYLYLIDALIKNGDYVEAEEKTDFILTRYKDSPMAHQYKSLIEYNKKNYRDSISFAEKAIASGLELQIAKMVAGISAYQLEEYERAYNYLNPLEEYLPTNHNLRKIIAIIKLKLGYTDSALQSFGELEGLSGEDVNLLQASSVELLQANEFNAAYELISKAEMIQPESAVIKAQKGVLLLSQNDLSGIEALEQALSLEPSLEEVELTLALEYLRSDEINKVQKIIDKWANSEDKKVSAKLLEGVLFSKKGEIASAKNSFEEVLILEKGNIAALFNLALLFELENKKDAAVTYYKNVIDQAPNHRGALQRLTQLQYQSERPETTIEYLENKIKGSDQNIQLLLTLARNYYLNGQLLKSIETLESVNKGQLLPVDYWTALGDSYLHNKELKKANATYEEALKIFPKNYILSMRRIGVLEIEGNYKEALTSANELYKTFPGNNRIEMLLAYFELNNGNKEAASNYINLLQNKSVTHPLLSSVIGKLALSNRSFEKAIEHYNLAYEAQKTAESAVNLARSLKFSGKQKEAEKLLESFLEDNAGNNKVRFLLAELYSREDKEKILAQYLQILKHAPDNVLALNNAAWNHYQLGNLKEALEYINKAYKLDPGAMFIQESYGTILFANKEYEKAYKILKAVKDKGSKDVEALNALIEVEGILKGADI